MNLTLIKRNVADGVKAKAVSPLQVDVPEDSFKHQDVLEF